MTTATKKRSKTSTAQKAKWKEQAQAKTEQALADLQTGIQAIHSSEEWTAMLNVASKFHQYSFKNLVLIHLQCHEATRVAGYKAWQELGRQVRKGEKGIMILAPCTIKVTENNCGDRPQDIGSYRLVGFRTTTVFDISQTDGEDLPSVTTELYGDDAGLYDRLKQFAISRDFELTVDPSKAGEGGYCQYKKDGSIRINVTETNPLSNARVLAHELGHALLHPEAEYRGHGKASMKELEADSVAYCVLQHFGLDSSESSFGYIAGWNRSSEKAIAQLQESGARIMEATHTIVEWIESKSIQR